jgi:hypothetical protein
MGFIGATINRIKANWRARRIINALQLSPKEIPVGDYSKPYLSFSHIGMSGDIIYAIPAMRALAKQKNIRLYISTTTKTMYRPRMKHPSKQFTFSQKALDYIKPLLLAQEGFEECSVLNSQTIDFDLNSFRKYPFNYNVGSIVRWYFLTFGINYNTSLPWLSVTPNSNYNNEIVIARSFRYRAHGIDYSFLKKYNNISFLGIEEEFKDLQQQLPQLKYISTDNALQMAEIIKGCQLFIGNQSFPFAIAEALKVKRVLEVSFECPNVIVEGDDGFDFCYQAQFEKIVGALVG